MNMLNANQFKLMLENGSNLLTNQHAEIDALNVFPVPDGDTGTNMYLTFSAGVNDSLGVLSEYVGDIAKSLSKGLLMGARGNSGVILSQIFRGFAQAVEGMKEVDILTLSKAFVKGSEVAYRSVMKPVEGTILTVIRESSYMAFKYVEDHPECTLLEYLDYFVKEAKSSLEFTPELLPVLKEVGVVDSGGAGLVVILEGFKESLLGNKIELNAQIAKHENIQALLESEEFGYCTEFIIRLSENSLHAFSEDKLKNSLAKIGESLVVVQDDDIVKVHVHTLKPGEALNLAQRYGEFVKLKIENMQEQHQNLLVSMDEPVSVQSKATQTKKFGIIAVAAGEGLIQYFKELRADIIISGGQTMNPSTEDFVGAISELNAEEIFLLPNNSNIILAAQQAKTVCENRKIHVISTTTIPQGIAACLMFNPEVSAEENLAEMQSAVERTKTGQVTYAIKDTSFDGISIKEGDYMGIIGKEIVSNSKNKKKVVTTLIDALITDDVEIISIIKGEDSTVEEADGFKKYIDDKYEIEVEIINGEQPVYGFIIGAE